MNYKIQQTTFEMTQPNKLKIDNTTRWNSIYLMFERLLKLKDLLNRYGL